MSGSILCVGTDFCKNSKSSGRFFIPIVFIFSLKLNNYSVKAAASKSKSSDFFKSVDLSCEDYIENDALTNTFAA